MSSKRERKESRREKKKVKQNMKEIEKKLGNSSEVLQSVSSLIPKRDQSEPKSSGTFWFYSGDYPYLFFHFGKTEFYINFETVEYCKPNTTDIVLDTRYYPTFESEDEKKKLDGVEDKVEETGDDRLGRFSPELSKEEFQEYINAKLVEREETKKRYRSKLKNLRFLLFKYKETEHRLDLGFNCNSYHLVYSSDGDDKVRIELDKHDAKTVMNALDETFKQGKKDADGDFKQTSDKVVGLEDFVISTNCSVWKYERTDNHNYPKLEDMKFEIVRLPKGTELTFVPESSGFLPPQ